MKNNPLMSTTKLGLGPLDPLHYRMDQFNQARFNCDQAIILAEIINSLEDQIKQLWEMNDHLNKLIQRKFGSDLESNPNKRIK